MSSLQGTPSEYATLSETLSDFKKSLPEIQRPQRRIPFLRKRLPRDQALALLAVFEVKTHPTKDEREELANDLGM